ISGDMNDPDTEIAQLLATQKVTVRKPEQGTAPKLFYINGNDVTLHPTATERVPESYMWADTIPLHVNGKNGHVPHTATASATASHSNGTAIRIPQTQGQPSSGPISFGGSVAEHMVQVAYNAQHKIPWHWPVPAYLVTKGIGAGIFMLLSLGIGLNLFESDGLTNLVLGFIALVFIGLTTVFLVIDLERPERFLYILLRPQWKSWLARGAVLLIGFSTILGLWWLFELGAYLYDYEVPLVQSIFLWVGLLFAIGTAVYTAFLFAQAEGRDLWQSTLLPWHLVVQALLVGSGTILFAGIFFDMPQEISSVAGIVFVAALIVDLFVTLIGEFSIPHASEVAAKAAHEISHGHYRNHFRYGSILLGHVVPLGLMLLGLPIAAAIAAICAIIGLYLFEYAFVMAPQEIPNS
ncbi:MAG: polysulfide reductase NrfD, partial [Anaerolineae bacterium]|nr:polysulfide reductase NrfD [Anaerolineae bacterium]